MVGWVVGLILLVFPASLALSSAAGANVLLTTIALSAAPPATTTTTTIADPAATPTSEVPATSTTYTVVSGDCLSAIAQRFYGDEGAWSEIWEANANRVMQGGGRFVDPNLIYAGWTLTLPGIPVPDAVSAPPVAQAPPPTVPAVYHQTQPHQDTVREDAPNQHPFTSDLPDLIALGIGAMGCAALFRRSRRLRLLRQAELVPRSHADVSDFTIDTDVRLARFARVPSLRDFEIANRQLARALRDRDPLEGAVGVRAICVGPSGVDFWLMEPDQPAPDGFLLTANGKAWRADLDLAPTSETAAPYFLVAVPIGEDDEGTWLVPLLPGSCLQVLGAASESLLRAIRPVQEGWAWGHMVLVTTDPIAAADEVRLHGGGGPGMEECQVIYLGDPKSLPDGFAPLVSVVSTLPVSTSEVTVVVDHLGASIHPLGRTVRPHLLDSDTAAAIDDVTQPQSDQVTEDEGQTLEQVGSDYYSLAPGQVDIRLLAVTPRVDGLHEELPANRSRRAVELVAYLALHQPDAVTSDRLRTRVLGSSDADAASKTLFNTATAARRAMGTNAAGAPLLPPGSRTGHYRVSDDVTIDVLRAGSMAAIGNAAEDPNVAMAHLRAALDLVEGEPLANALSGYTWWEAEGHGARIAAVLVNAACNLAALAVEAGRYELAQWGLGQARLVDPYSEAISRAAMQVAAAAGDADRLRREWRDCQRRIDELDPGATPSPRTERLYGQLAQRVLVSTSGSEES
jgi:DNA-binding SARP family transcriptional activator